MPSQFTAHLMHAALYLQRMDSANDRYIAGDGLLAALNDFDRDWPNIQMAQKWAAEFNSMAVNDDVKQDELARSAVDLCNAYPDAGAYLISLRLNAQERVNWLEAAIDASGRLNNKVTTQAHLGNLGLAYYELGQIQAAMGYFERALEVAHEIGDRRHQGIWLGNLGNACAAVGDHQQAIHYHKQHLAIARETGDQRGEANALGNLGVSYAFIGQNQQALTCYLQQLSIARQIGDPRAEGYALLNLGLTHYDLWQPDQARQYFEQSLNTARSIHDRSLEGLALGSLGDVLLASGEYSAAQDCLREALVTAQALGDRLNQIRYLGSLGNLQNVLDELPQALDLYAQQLEIAQSVGNRPGICNALCNQISVYRKMGNFSEALLVANRALIMAREIQAQDDEAFISWQLGLIHEAKGDLHKAVAYFQITVEYEQRIGHPDALKDAAHLDGLLSQLATQG